MKINWTVRFKNKVWLTSFVSFVVATLYQLLAMFDVAPIVTQGEVTQIVAAVLQLLSLLGVIVDPTTKGLGDNERVLKFTDPA